MKSLTSNTSSDSQIPPLCNTPIHASRDMVLMSDIHNLESTQINQLISTRFNSDTIRLIKKLSHDLSEKENELKKLRLNTYREGKLYELLLNHLSHDEIERYLKQPEGSRVDESSEEVENHILLDDEFESIKNWKVHDNDYDYDYDNISYSFDNPRELPLELQSIRRKKSKFLLIPPPMSQIPSSKIDNMEIDKYGFIKQIRRPSLRVSSTSTTISAAIGSDKQETNNDSSWESSETSESPESSLESNNPMGILINENNKSRLIDQLKQISQIHDDVNLYFDKKWDILMKDIKYTFLFNSIQHEDNTSSLLGVRGINLSHHPYYYYYFPLVNLINQFGIPLRYRYLWLDLSGANQNMRINGEYQELLNANTKNNKIVEKNIEQINLDLHRTLPSNYYFNNIFELKPGINFYKLQRILYAFVKKFPNIGYVQGMNKIIATLLLGLQRTDQDEEGNEDEEEVFWLFVALIEEILPRYNNNKCFFNSINEIHDHNVRLKNQLLQKLLPELYAHFIKLNVEIEIITMNWWLTLFLELKLISLDSWFKIFDNLLIEDQVLFLPCLTLAILKCLLGSLMKLSTNDEIYKFLNLDSYNYNHTPGVNGGVDSDNDDGKFKLKFHELMKNYLNYSRRKEVSDLYLKE